MKNLVLPIVAALSIATIAAPALAETNTIAPAKATTVAALGARNLTLVDPAGMTVGMLVADGNGSFRLRSIGATTSTAPIATAPFKLDFSRALTPAQMNGVYDREIDRVFNIDHSN